MYFDLCLDMLCAWLSQLACLCKLTFNSGSQRQAFMSQSCFSQQIWRHLLCWQMTEAWKAYLAQLWSLQATKPEGCYCQLWATYALILATNRHTGCSENTCLSWIPCASRSLQAPASVVHAIICSSYYWFLTDEPSQLSPFLPCGSMCASQDLRSKTHSKSLFVFTIRVLWLS